MTYLTALDGVPNFRDLGNLPLPGGVTRPGVIYRSAAPGSITDAGLAAMEASNLGAIADLRGDSERQSHPNRLPAGRPIRTKNLPITAGDMSATTLDGPPSDEIMAELLGRLRDGYVPTLGELYSLMLQQGKEQLTAVAQLASQSAAEGQSILVHCTAGKDRTGIASALILDSVGVERRAIVDNYTESQVRLAGPWADRMLSRIEQTPPDPRVVALVTTSPAEAIQAALDWVDENYDGSTGYLQSGGMTDSELDGLRAALT